MSDDRLTPMAMAMAHSKRGDKAKSLLAGEFWNSLSGAERQEWIALAHVALRFDREETDAELYGRALSAVCKQTGDPVKVSRADIVTVNVEHSTYGPPTLTVGFHVDIEDTSSNPRIRKPAYAERPLHRRGYATRPSPHGEIDPSLLR